MAVCELTEEELPLGSMTKIFNLKGEPYEKDNSTEV